MRAPPPAEAMAMATASKTGSDVFFVDRDCHPQTLAVLETRARGFGFELRVGDPEDGLRSRTRIRRIAVLYPVPSARCATTARSWPASSARPAPMSIMATDLLSLCLLVPPGELGADVAIGSAQRFRRADGLWRPARSLLRHP
jgi:glycine dehydrogenase